MKIYQDNKSDIASVEFGIEEEFIIPVGIVLLETEEYLEKNVAGHEPKEYKDGIGESKACNSVNEVLEY
jgi:hypothetical protein